MKRSVPADFDPVYPYGKRPLNIIPPFYSTNGFVEAPTATLSLKLANPVEFTQNGAIGLKLGGGLSINQDGELESQNVTSTVNPPLFEENGGLNLKYGENLTVDSNNSLIVKSTSPITSSATGLGLNLGNGLNISSTGSLQANIGSGLQFNNQTIQVYPHEPLNLDTVTGKLQLRVGEGINVSNNSLIAKLGQGLTFNNTNIQLNLSSPFTFIDNKLALQLGSGLNVDGNNLQVNFGKGLYLNSSDNNKLEVNVKAPLNYSSNSSSIGIEIGNGLELTGTTLGSALKIKAGAGIRSDLNAVTVAAGPGLTFGPNNYVRVNLANGLELDSSNKMQAKLGNGLQFNSNGSIEVNVGTGLTISNGEIVLANNTPSAYTDYTLWTTPDPSPNASIKTDLDAKLVLTLSKAGSTVIGTIGIFALKAPLTSISENSINVEIFFDANGQINFSTSSLKSYWGFRAGDSYNPSSNLNPLYLMPNTNAYPQGRKTITQVFPLEVYLNGNTSKPVPLEVAFNTLSSTGFSLEFTWRNLNAYTGETFAVSLGNFTYISQM